MTVPHRILSKSLAIVIVLAGVGLLWLAVITPLRNWHADTLRQASALRDGIDRLDQTVLALAAERAALTSSPDLGLIWQADQYGQASAMVQSRLSEIARGMGLTLRSISPLPPRDIPLAQGVGFRVELEAPLDRLVGYLVEIEHSSPVLSIDRATIRRLVRPTDGQTPSSLQPELFVQFDVVAPVQLIPSLTGDDT